MRPFTRTSRRAACPQRPAGGAILLLLFLAFSPLSAFATPIVAEGEVRVENGDLARAREAAVDAALARAVRIVLARHVPGAQLEGRQPELVPFLQNPLASILRYAVVDETETPGHVRVIVEAEVDREGLLARVREAGYEVVQLGAHPRVLVQGWGGLAPRAVEVVRKVLGDEGFATRVLGEAEDSSDVGALAAAARDLGCHVAVAVSARAEEPRRTPEGQSSGMGQPVPVGYDVPVEVSAWMVDARRVALLGEVKASAVESGEVPRDLESRGVERAGREVAYRLLILLEQSGWSLGGDVEVIDLRLTGLTAPSLVETIERGLAGVTEVVEVSLREIGYHSAVWRVVVADAGLGWASLLDAVQVPGGHLALEGFQEPEEGAAVMTVRAALVSP